MDCSGCRCYAREQSLYPDSYQFCGFQGKDYVYACDPSCCDKGCPPGGKPTKPFKILKKHEFYRPPPPYLKLLLILLLILSTLFMV